MNLEVGHVGEAATASLPQYPAFDLSFFSEQLCLELKFSRCLSEWFLLGIEASPVNAERVCVCV